MSFSTDLKQSIMKLEIPITEVQKMINDYFQMNLKLINIEENKIQVTNIDSVVLTVSGVKDDMVLFNYEVSGLIDLISKVAHFFMKKKLKTIPVKWDVKTKKISLDLKKIHAISKLLKLMNIDDVHIVNDSMVLDLSPTVLFSNMRLKA